MKPDLCALCKKKRRDMIYAVDPSKEVPLCGACFGKWAPSKLAALLGLKRRNMPSMPLEAMGMKVID